MSTFIQSQWITRRCVPLYLLDFSHLKAKQKKNLSYVVQKCATFERWLWWKTLMIDFTIITHNKSKTLLDQLSGEKTESGLDLIHKTNTHAPVSPITLHFLLHTAAHWDCSSPFRSSPICLEPLGYITGPYSLKSQQPYPICLIISKWISVTGSYLNSKRMHWSVPEQNPPKATLETMPLAENEHVQSSRRHWPH